MSKMLAILSAATVGALSAAPAHAGPTLDKIKANKTISIGYRDASIPFSFLGSDQKPIGFSMDLCAKLVERLKSDLSVPDLKIELVAVNSSNRIPLIQNGVVDIECGGTASSQKRLEQVSFSVSTFASRTALLARSADRFKTPGDLKGKTVVVTQGSDAIGIGQGISKQDNLNLSFLQGKDHAESLLLLTTGRASAFIEADILLAGLKAQYAKPNDLMFLTADYGPTYYYGLMFSKDDPDFKKTVDDVLSKMMASGEFTKAYDKWFLSPIPPTNMNLNFPMSVALKDRVARPSDVVSN